MLGKLILFLISGFLILGTGCSRTEGGKDITGKEEMQPETENTGDTEQNTTVTENSEEKEQTPAETEPQESPSENGTKDSEAQEVNKEQMKILTQAEGIDDEQAAYIMEKLGTFVPDMQVAASEAYSDDVGKGIQITSEAGEKYNVYMYQSGVIYGIKEVSSGKYLYMVYE